jgi:hypothetical protein
MKTLLILCLNTCSMYDAALIGVDLRQPGKAESSCWCDDGEDRFQVPPVEDLCGDECGCYIETPMNDNEWYGD